MKKSLVTIKVRNGDLAQALKVFKKKVSASGHIDELKKRQEYIKPTTKRRLVKQKAKRRNDLQVLNEKLLQKF